MASKTKKNTQVEPTKPETQEKKTASSKKTSVAKAKSKVKTKTANKSETTPKNTKSIKSKAKSSKTKDTQTTKKSNESKKTEAAKQSEIKRDVSKTNSDKAQTEQKTNPSKILKSNPVAKFLVGVVAVVLILVLGLLVGLAYYRTTGQFAYRELYLAAKDNDEKAVLNSFDTYKIAKDIFQDESVVDNNPCLNIAEEVEKYICEVDNIYGIESQIKLGLDVASRTGLMEEILPYQLENEKYDYIVEDLEIDEKEFSFDFKHLSNDSDWSEVYRSAPIIIGIRAVTFEKQDGVWKVVKVRFDISKVQEYVSQINPNSF